MKTLKDDIDGVLIYVCACFSWSAKADVTFVLGWFILCYSHRIRRAEDSGFKNKPRRPIGLLSESVRSDACATTCLRKRPNPNKFYSPIALPDLPSIGI